MSTTTTDATVLGAIEQAIRDERFRHAGQLLDGAIASTPTPTLRLARARLELASGGSADEAILRARALLGDDLAAAERGLAYELIAAGFVRKRLAAAAHDAVSAGEAACGPTPGLAVARAAVLLLGDDRPAAAEAYRAALALAPDHGAARLGLGELLVAMAAFDDARRELRDVPRTARQWGAAQRALAGVAAALGERAVDVELRTTIVRELATSDWAQGDGISLGVALAAAGRHAEAAAALRAAWTLDPSTSSGAYARTRLNHLEGALARGAIQRRELTAFPTTAQKWNYCGPAVLELVLRYFRFEADQDSIARIVKREHGTPMVEIVAHLRGLGVEARRVEGTAARIRAAIDLGCPVIVQEEYSTTSHVAVITGYDDALGVFVAQDPMRHQPMVKSFEFTESAGVMYGNGAIVVLGPSAEAAARRPACDEAGLVELRHLALVDECARRRSRVRGDGVEPLAPGEVVELCDEALRLSPNFRLAHHQRLRGLRDLARVRAISADEALRELALVRVRFGDEEWCCQLLAESLMERGLYDEAFVQALRALRRDAHDEWNLQLMGEACWLAGDLAGAETHLLAALREGPDLQRAAENLAAVYLRALEAPRADQATDHASDDDHPSDEHGDDAEREPSMPPKQLRSMPARDRAELAVRAAHFSAVALAGNPANAFNHAVAGELAARRGRLADAVAAMRRCLELDAQRGSAWHRLAELLEASGDNDAALATRREIVRRMPDSARSYTGLANALVAAGEHGEAAEALRQGLGRGASGREALIEPLFDVIEHLESGEAAAAQVRRLAEATQGDDDVLRAAVETLEQNGQRGHAIALARQLAEATPNDPGAVWRLARLLDDTGVAREETEALLRRLVQLAPDAPIVRVRLAWCVLERDPGEALALLAPALEQESPDVYDAAAAALARQGRASEADAALAKALQAAPSRDLGLARLSTRHARANRFDRALELARLIDLAAVARDPLIDDDTREYVEDAWLTAHRLAGRAVDALPWVRARCERGVPPHLAFEVYYAFRSTDRALAAAAASVRAAGQESAADQLEWRLIAAGLRAKLGQPAELEALAAAMPAHGGAWAELAEAYRLCDRFDDATRAATRAHELDPLDGSVFTAYIEALTRQNRIDDALACARAYAEARPWEHQAPERLGILLAKLGHVDEALAQSARAVDAAPYCHVSQQSRALALLAAGDLPGALRFARQAAGNEPSAPDAAGDADDDLLIAALTGDGEALERGLAALERSSPGVLLGYRARLREICAAGGTAPLAN